MAAEDFMIAKNTQLPDFLRLKKHFRGVGALVIYIPVGTTIYLICGATVPGKSLPY